MYGMAINFILILIMAFFKPDTRWVGVVCVCVLLFLLAGIIDFTHAITHKCTNDGSSAIQCECLGS